VFDIGSSLAAARQAQGLELPDVEALTCIRQRNITALEEERFDLLPGRAYSRAFLRTYAAALGLDADRFVAEFEQRFPEPEEHEAPAQLRRRRRQVPVRFLLAVALLAGVIAFVAWSGNSQSPHLVKFGEPPVANTAAPVVVPRPKAPAVVDRPLVIHAAHGPCWLLIRRGGEAGPVVYEATLRAGQTIRFAAPKLWIRLGAPWNVDVRRGARTFRASSTTQPENLVL
jgi:hypothetical protein